MAESTNLNEVLILTPSSTQLASSFNRQEFENLLKLLKEKKTQAFIENFETFKNSFNLGSENVLENATSEEGETAVLLSVKERDDFKNNCSNFLIEATKNGLSNVVKRLLEEDIDINSSTAELPAGFQACIRGYHKILDMLLKHKNLDGELVLNVNLKDKNMLNEVCEHFWVPKVPETEATDERNHQICFDLLMACSKIDINQQDQLGCTPLYYALRYKNYEATKVLLRRKCYVGKLNIFNKAQICNIRKEILEDFLDECVTVDVHEPIGEQRITIDFNFLAAPKEEGQDFFEEIAPLEYIANNAELRSLILHPVLLSFLYLKWIKLSILFYMNLLLFFLFMGSFTTYIIFYQSDHSSGFWSVFFFFMSVVSLVLMVAKEIMQCYMCYKNYFKSFMNWFELMLIVLICIVLLEIKTLRIIRGITVLCITYEFLILFGDLPNFSVSTHMVILKRVFITFLKSIGLYSILLFGFAFCFYTLFGDNGQESKTAGKNDTKCCDDNNGDDFHSFKTPGLAILKTIVMFSGELEASSINLGSNDAFYSIIFSLFVFLITIVLLNLINGLSVSDVFQIKDEGQLVALCQKIHVLNKYERIIMSRTASFKFLKSIVSIFPEFVKDAKIEIDSNNRVKLCSTSAPQKKVLEYVYNLMLRNIIKFDSVLKHPNKKTISDIQKTLSDGFHIKLDSNIMKKIQLVLEERGEKGNLKDYQSRILSIENKLEMLSKMDEKLERIIRTLAE